jgi:hypothetical protein
MCCVLDLHQDRACTPAIGLRPAAGGNGLPAWAFPSIHRELQMDAIIYLVGLVVIVMFILSFFGLR